jgi:hypothetical protein
MQDLEEQMPNEPSVIAGKELSVLLITLLNGVIYVDSAQLLWSHLLKLRAQVQDYAAVLGLELILNEPEGYAFLRSPIVPAEDDDQQAALPRLMARRQLSFQTSLLLALLRKKLAEFDASGGDTRLILSREEILELTRVFLPESSNEVKLAKTVDAQINKIVDLGYLRKLKAASPRQQTFEVQRILKAFVDAQWLSDFNQRLAQYQQKAIDSIGSDDEGQDDD